MNKEIKNPVGWNLDFYSATAVRIEMEILLPPSVKD